jgi:filamentous hemagglutinin family protein
VSRIAVLGAAAALLCAPAAQVRAQAVTDIQTDGSLGPGFSCSGGACEIPESLGTAAGSNLFHSFEAFSIGAGDSATFTATNAYANVISRVTGSAATQIDGLLASTVLDAAGSGADVYLLNPNGIFVGAGGSFDVPASLYLSTADSLRLMDEGEDVVFRVADAVPELAAAPPMEFGFLGGDAGTVAVDASTGLGGGGTLGLVGGDVVIGETAGAVLLAGGGTIRVVATGTTAVSDVPVGADWDVSGYAPGELGEIRMANTTLDTLQFPFDASQGRVVLRGGRLVAHATQVFAGGTGVAGETAIDAQVTGLFRLDLSELDTLGWAGASKRVGGIRIGADEIVLRDDSELSSVSRGDVGADPIELSAGRVTLSSGSVVVSTAEEAAAGAAIDVMADELVVGARTAAGATGIFSASTGSATGRGGDVTLRADRLAVSGGGQIRSVTETAARGGEISVVAPDAVVVDGSFTGGDPAILTPSSIVSSTSGGGRGGDVSVQAGRVDLTAGGRIESTTTSSGRGGDVEVIATGDIDVRGDVAGGANASGIITRSGLVIDSPATGDAGDLQVEAESLRLHGNAIVSARSLGFGRAGNLSVTADESVELTGSAAGRPAIEARAYAGTFVPDEVRTLRIEAPSVELRNGGEIATSALNVDHAADVVIEADDILVTGRDAAGNGSAIFAATLLSAPGAGDSGHITLDAERSIEVSDGGVVSIETRGTGDSQGLELRAGEAVSIVGAGSALRSTTLLDPPFGGAGSAGDILIRDTPLVEISDGGAIEAESFGVGRSGAIALRDVGALAMTGGGRVSARATSLADAGRVSLAADVVQMVDSEVTTEATTGGGGQIDVLARGRVELVGSRITTSVIESGSAGDGGDINIAHPQFVVLNHSQILAQAQRGNGGNIQITTDNYIESIDSEVDASSQAGIDGLVLIRSPDVNIALERDTLNAEIVDPSALMREPCSARATGEGGSFEVLGPEAVPPQPDAPLPSPYLPPARRPSAPPLPGPAGATGEDPAARAGPGVPLVVVGCPIPVTADVAGP